MNPNLKTAVVTGADRGMGMEVCRILMDKGFLVFAGRVLPEYTLLDDLKKEYPELLRPVQLDVTSLDDMLAVKKMIEEETGRLDLLVSNAAMMGAPGGVKEGAIGENPDYDFEMLEKFFMANAVAAPLLVDTFLPLLEKGEMKRLHFTSSEVSSVSLKRRDDSFRYSMSKTALNLGVRMIYNTLREKGYTFRMYHPGWVKRQLEDGSYSEGAELFPPVPAAELCRQIFEERPDEDRLVLLDYQYQELSF